MNKKVKNFFIVTLFFFVTLNIAWFYGCNKIIQVINLNFAGKNIEIGDITINFSKAQITGYPYKVSVELLDFQENSQAATLNYDKPLKVGYNILAQKLFLSYDGDVTARLKPFASGFGIRINGEFNYYIFYPLTPMLIKTLLTTKDYFELINYVRNIQIKFGKVKAYDLQSKAQILDQDYLEATLTPKFTTHYKSLPEFLNNIPKVYYLDASSNVTLGTNNHYVPLSLIFLHLPTKPLKFNLSSKFVTSSQKPIIKDIFSDCEVDLYKYDIIYDTFESNGKFYLKNFNQDKEVNIEVRSSSETFIKKPLFETFKKRIIYLFHQLKSSKVYADNGIIIKKIIDDPEKYIPRLHELGKMVTDIDVSFKTTNKISNIDIKKFTFDNEVYGLELYNNTSIKSDLTWVSKGQFVLKKYKACIDLIVGYLQRVAFVLSNLDKSFIKISDNKFKETIKTFMKRISNHPETNSDDLYYDINLSNNNNTARIGSVSFEEAKNIYAQIMAQSVLQDVINSQDPKGELKKLIPNLKNKPNQIMDKLKKQQKKLKPNLLKDLLQ